jgi:hypothetical protein
MLDGIRLKRQLVSLVLLTFVWSCAAAENSTYFVFIGEKISLNPVPPKEGEMPFDARFLAKYRVIEPFRGTFDGTEIEFTVFDHMGLPPFSKYRHVLLYVERHEGKYYHSKYQFSPLYKTKDGRWAGPYDAYDYGHEYNKDTPIKPVVIDFAKPVVVDIPRLDRSEIEKWFPEPYYRIEGRKATAVYGNYVPELFLLKQNGVLKARGDFQ